MNRIKLLRNAQTPKMSQGQLANLVGVGRTTVTMWENGANEPDNTTLIKLAEIFHVSVEYLLGNDANEEYSQKFRDKVFCALEENSLSGDEECANNTYRWRELCEGTGRLFFDDVCSVAVDAGISIDDIIWGNVKAIEKSLGVDESTPRDKQERQIMDLVGRMNTVQKEFLLALLHTVVARSQGTPASDLASTGETILKSEHLG